MKLTLTHTHTHTPAHGKTVVSPPSLPFENHRLSGEQDSAACGILLNQNQAVQVYDCDQVMLNSFTKLRL